MGEPIFPRWVLVTAAIAAVCGSIYLLRGVLVPVSMSMLLAYMLDPLVDRLEARRIPRGIGIAILLFVAGGLITLFIVIAVPGIVRDVGAFITELPAAVARLRATIEPHLAQQGIRLPTTLDEVAAELQAHSSELHSAVAPAATAVRAVLGGTASVASSIGSIVLFGVLVFYLLYDFDRMTAAAKELIPLKVRPFVLDLANEIDATMSQFIRGQLTLMLAMAILYAAAYSLIGVRLAVVIGIVAGIVAFIPYVGGGTAVGLAVLMCLLDWGGWERIAMVIGAWIVIQLIESYVLQPRIVGEKVGLSAVWVLIALMAGGDLFGFVGVLLAVPAAAVLKIFVVRALAWYRKSELYLGGPHIGSPLLAGVLHEEGLPDTSEVHRQKVAADTVDHELAAVAAIGQAIVPAAPADVDTEEHESPPADPEARLSPAPAPLPAIAADETADEDEDDEVP